MQLGLSKAARSGSNEPRLKLWLLSSCPSSTGSPLSSAPPPSTPLNQSLGTAKPFAIMALNTSAESFEVDSSSADVSGESGIRPSLPTSVKLFAGKTGNSLRQVEAIWRCEEDDPCCGALGPSSCESSRIETCFEMPDVSASIMVERSPSTGAGDGEDTGIPESTDRQLALVGT